MNDLIERFENGIVDLLKLGLGSAFYIAPFPDNPKDFDPAKMEAASLVHYSGSKYAASANGQPTSQMRELQFSIQLYLHALRDHRGGYQAIEATRKSLQNVSIEGATPFKMISDDLVERQSGKWVWEVKISCSMLAVAARLGRQAHSPLMTFENTGN